MDSKSTVVEIKAHPRFERIAKDTYERRLESLTIYASFLINKPSIEYPLDKNLKTFADYLCKQYLDPSLSTQSLLKINSQVYDLLTKKVQLGTDFEIVLNKELHQSLKMKKELACQYKHHPILDDVNCRNEIQKTIKEKRPELETHELRFLTNKTLKKAQTRAVEALDNESKILRIKEIKHFLKIERSKENVNIKVLER